MLSIFYDILCRTITHNSLTESICMHSIKKSLFTLLVMSSTIVFSMQLDLPKASAGPQEIVNKYLIACLNGKTKIVIELLKNNQSLRLQEKTDKNRLTGLMFAARNGNLETLKEMLKFHTKEERYMKSRAEGQQSTADDETPGPMLPGSAGWWADHGGHEDCVTLLGKYR